MAAAATYAGVSAVISNIAREPSFNAKIAANAISLPGPDCVEKAELEQQIAALCARVDFLERKSNNVGSGALPPTPAQEGPEEGLVYTPSGTLRSNGPSAHGRRGSNKERALWVSNWLAAKETNGGTEEPAAALTEEQLNYLRSHLNQQADQVSFSGLSTHSPPTNCTFYFRSRTNANTSSS